MTSTEELRAVLIELLERSRAVRMGPTNESGGYSLPLSLVEAHVIAELCLRYDSELSREMLALIWATVPPCEPLCALCELRP